MELTTELTTESTTELTENSTPKDENFMPKELHPDPAAKIFHNYCRDDDWLLNPQFADMSIKVIHDDKILMLPAHRAPLVYGSKFFETTITKWKTGDHPVVDLTAINSEVVVAVLLYIYRDTGIIYMSSKPDLIHALIDLNDFFMFRKSILDYYKGIQFNVTFHDKNFHSWFNLASIIPSLASKLLRYASELKDFNDIDFEHLTHDQLHYLLNHVKLGNVRKLSAVLEWAIVHKELPHKLLRQIRISSISYNDYLEFIKPLFDKVVIDKNLRAMFSLMFDNDNIYKDINGI